MAESSQTTTQSNIRSKFETFGDTCNAIKGCVYLIVRLRKLENDTYQYVTLGTGFLAGKNRLVTCAHVIDSASTEELTSKHQKGDKYIFVKRDENNTYHQSALIELTRDDNLFVYADIDTSVIYLPDDFYGDGKTQFHDPNNYIKFSPTPLNVGSDVGVLGYPLQNVTVDKKGQLDIRSVYIRADKGVVNTRVRKGGVKVYEFTLSFNPGNSGGPIVDTRTGEAVAIVSSFETIPLKPITFPVMKNGERQSIDTVLTTIYSRGIAMDNLVDKKLHDQHSIGL